jgi:hypothetical protein
MSFITLLFNVRSLFTDYPRTWLSRLLVETVRLIGQLTIINLKVYKEGEMTRLLLRGVAIRENS